jgi:hypothetical protein
LQNLNALYLSLRGLLSDQMREVSFCRQRLTELSDLFKDSQPTESVTKMPAECLLLPDGCKDLQEAVSRVEAGIADEDLLAFDGQVQELIRKQYRALVNVCLASSTVVRALGEALLQAADVHLQGRLEGTDAAVLWLSRYDHSPEDQVRLQEDLQKAYEAAAPHVGSASDGRELVVISAPPGPAGDRLRHLASQAFPGAAMIVGSRDDEILFLRQAHAAPLVEFEYLGPEAQEAYRQYLAQDPSLIHSRADIEEWRAAETVA